MRTHTQKLPEGTKDVIFIISILLAVFTIFLVAYLCGAFGSIMTQEAPKREAVTDVVKPAESKAETAPVAKSVVSDPTVAPQVNKQENEAAKESIKADIEKRIPENKDTAVAPVDDGKIFLVSSDIWKTAKTPKNVSDGTRLPGVIFTVPKGTKIYAPFSGTLIESPFMDKKGRKSKSLLLVKGRDLTFEIVAEKDLPHINFLSNETVFAPGLKSGSFVEEGKLIATVESEKTVFDGIVTPSGNLVITPGQISDSKLDGSSKDLVAYMEQAVNLC